MISTKNDSIRITMANYLKFIFAGLIIFCSCFFQSRLFAEPQIFTNKIGMRFVLVSSGSFIMGSPETEKGHNWRVLL
jgi:hypothetical protein